MSVALHLYIRRLPMVRLLIPFMLGIGCQWYWPLPLSGLTGLFASLSLLLFITLRLSLVQRFLYSQLTGFLLFSLLFNAGAILVWKQDVRNEAGWIGHCNQADQVLLLTLEEPLVEKPNSFKALARISGVYTKNHVEQATGQVILYFKKDSSTQRLIYGSQIITGQALQRIRNTGNPGSFDFQQYSLRQGTTHQVYLTANDYKVLPQKEENLVKKWVYRSRQSIIDLIQQYIPGDKEAGLAEALLIGYKDDLDKNLVQSYSNTGVVHVIAISGLHLGIIYWLLLFLTRPLQHRSMLWLRFLLIVSGLWAFSLLAGAQPSVLRAAVMFTCIALSTVIDRKGSVYNTLALSAFLLLCINPFWLWDVGFQLSYLAVLSILLFYKPIYNWVYFSNKLVNFVWQLIAISLAAQLLTLPISIYYFHQFPVLFLLSNLVAVPLSSIILIGEILLCALAFIPGIARQLGQLLASLIQWLNNYVERLDKVSFAVWDNLSVTLFQTVLLYLTIISIAVWLLNKQAKATWLALGSLLAFMLLQSFSLIQAGKQQQLIVYNIPKHQAIDIIQGRTTAFIGDPALKQNTSLWNFHLQPSRVLHRIEKENSFTQKVFTLGNKQCLIVDTTLSFQPQLTKPVIDVLILSKSPKLYLEQMAETVSVKQIIVDGSVPRWKADLWKRSAVALHIPFYDVSEKGAFVMPFQSPTFAAP
jgi:competence protein ComEC